MLKSIQKKLYDVYDPLYQEESKSLEKLLVKDSERLILLQTNHDSSDAFRLYLTRGDHISKKALRTVAEKRLLDAFVLCEEYVNRYFKQGTISLKNHKK